MMEWEWKWKMATVITYFIGIILPQIYFETVARISIKINN